MKTDNRVFGRIHQSTGLLLILLLLALPSLGVYAGPFIAISLTQAERLSRQSREFPEQVRDLGGITRIAGMVYDQQNRDVILVGQANYGEQFITLDDFGVAARAVLGQHESPFVSIDPTSDTPRTMRQKVRYGKGTEQSQFGSDLLAADVVLKKLALGQLTANVWGLPSYFQLSADEWRATGKLNGLACRFWFFPTNLALANQLGVIVVNDLRVAVKTEIISATEGPRELHDDAGEAFATRLTEVVNDIAVAHKEVARLKPLFDLVGLVTAWERIAPITEADYWLKSFQPKRVDTTNDYDLLVVSDRLTRDGEQTTLRVQGGVELKAKIGDLNDGDATAFKVLVLESRPSTDSIIWRVPLEGWEIPDYVGSSIRVGQMKDVYPFGELKQREIGCFVNRALVSSGILESRDSTRDMTMPKPFGIPAPQPTYFNTIRSQPVSPFFGGSSHNAGTATRVEVPYSPATGAINYDNHALGAGAGFIAPSRSPFQQSTIPRPPRVGGVLMPVTGMTNSNIGDKADFGQMFGATNK